LELAALPTAVPCARMHARAIALEWQLSLLADDIELIVSELVTNATRAAGLARDDILATPVVRLSIVCDLRCVLIRVWDSNSQMPTRRDAGPDEERGRGLMLVEHLCTEWGAYREADGKVVWVLIG
jgi:anti-sigma regulatory factor (Ser/Thr protein kinase)